MRDRQKGEKIAQAHRKMQTELRNTKVKVRDNRIDWSCVIQIKSYHGLSIDLANMYKIWQEINALGFCF